VISRSRGTKRATGTKGYPTLAEFEASSVAAESFDHRAHVYVGWCYLQQYELFDAIGRFRAALRRLTGKLGVPKKYNETISCFFLIMIAERVALDPTADWSEWSAANAELCNDGGRILERYYSRQRIQSAQARTVFLLPDRIV